MPTVAEIAELLESLAPTALAADWDNVGLLIGRRRHAVERVMTCLTVTPETVEEAVQGRAGLIVSHHPFPFRSFKRVTDETPAGQMLLQLIAAGCAVYSPHTAFDSAADGINRMLAEGLGLEDIQPLELAVTGDALAGTGRSGQLAEPVTLAEFVERAKRFLRLDSLQVVGSQQQLVERVGIGCGSGGELLELAVRQGCDTFVTGEMRFHDCLSAQAQGVALVVAGHYATERFAVERLAETLADRLPGVTVWASTAERDPLQNW